MGKHFCIQKIEEDIFCLDLQYADLRRQATRRWPHSFRLQHSEGVDPPPRPPTPWWCQEAQEEGLHHSQEASTSARRPSWLFSNTTRSMVMARSSDFDANARPRSVVLVFSWLPCTTDNTAVAAT